VGKYHLKADICVILQLQEKYIAVKVVANKLKRKNICANPRSQNSSFFVAVVEEVLLKKMIYVIRSQ